jgi:hypothetical protein
MPRNASQIYSVPVGTDGIPNTIIYSGKYNTFIHDVETDLNTPRPINSGGTGATDPATALQNINGEMAGQVVNNYDSFAFVDGSFYSPPAATNPPVAGHAFAGTCYSWKANTTDFFIEARDLNDANVPNYNYVRRKTAGVWGAWARADQAAISYSDTTKVAKAGDTMTGLLLLSGDPVVALGAVTKQYVDVRVSPPQNVNLLVNGGFSVSQLNGTSGVNVSGPNTVYTVDQWQFGMQGVCVGRATLSTASSAPGFATQMGIQSSVPVTVLAAADAFYFYQGIEGVRISRLGWGNAWAQPITFGFYIYSNVTGKLTMSVKNHDATRSYLFDVDVNVANTWTWCSATIPGDTTGTWKTDNSLAMVFMFGLAAGTNYRGVAGWQTGNKITTAAGMNFASSASNQCYIAGATVLMGNQQITPTQAAEMVPSYADEFMSCKRYLQFIGDINYPVMGGVAQGAGSWYFNFPFVPSMRSAAITSTKNGTWSVTNATQPSVNSVSPSGAVLVTQSLAVGTFNCFPNAVGQNIMFDARI